MAFVVWAKPDPKKRGSFAFEPPHRCETEEEANKLCERLNKEKPLDHPGYVVQETRD